VYLDQPLAVWVATTLFFEIGLVGESLVFVKFSK
jgi:hypothetical protein